jgi:hypothetical protein
VVRIQGIFLVRAGRPGFFSEKELLSSYLHLAADFGDLVRRRKIAINAVLCSKRHQPKELMG